jgi:hypothetical protein
MKKVIITSKDNTGIKGKKIRFSSLRVISKYMQAAS